MIKISVLYIFHEFSAVKLDGYFVGYIKPGYIKGLRTFDYDL